MSEPAPMSEPPPVSEPPPLSEPLHEQPPAAQRLTGRPWKTWGKKCAWKLGRIVVVAYVGLAIVLATFQTWFIFPGAATQGRPDSVVRPTDSASEIVTLTAATSSPPGEKVVALFGRAL